MQGCRRVLQSYEPGSSSDQTGRRWHRKQSNRARFGTPVQQLVRNRLVEQEANQHTVLVGTAFDFFISYLQQILALQIIHQRIMIAALRAETAKSSVEQQNASVSPLVLNGTRNRTWIF